MDGVNIPAELATKPFHDWQLDLVTLFLIGQILGRAFTAIKAGGGLRGIWRAIMFGSSTAGTTSTFLALAMVGALAVTGCKATLEPGGAYAPAVTNSNGVVTATQAPDMAFYQVDAAFRVAYSTVDAVFKFEEDNRLALFKLSPDIKHTLDSIRPGAVKARDDYITARAAYMANPVPAGLSNLQTILLRMQQLTSAAQVVIPKS